MIIDKPWGKVVTYALNQPSSVRVITVEPGQETSVHYHQMRDEMWVVLDAGLTVQIGNRTIEATPGEEFIVSAETTHRITNTGRSAAESSRSPTATRPRTTPCASRTTTAVRSSPIGERHRRLRMRRHRLGPGPILCPVVGRVFQWGTGERRCLLVERGDAGSRLIRE